uniref:Uncharacterized protein n=1 Tax=Arundo donax TaxID=35708 RepID=A0A0A9BAG0_ARUDO
MNSAATNKVKDVKKLLGHYISK